MRNKKLGILVLIALLSVSNCVMANDNNDIDYSRNDVIERIKANKDTMAKVQDAMSGKDYQTAITLLNAYINEKPKKYEAYKLRGDAYYALRRYNSAQKDYQKAVDIKSSDDRLMTNTKYVSAIVLGADKNEQLQNAELGDLYGALMYAQKAMNDSNYTASYDSAVKYNSHIYLPKPNKNDINKINCPQKYGKILNPQGIDAKIYGAIDDIAKGNYDEALYKLHDVTTQYPNYYLGYYLTGVALSELEKDEDAIKSFQKSISLNPYDFESRASLGRIYYSKAETTFSQADARKSVDYFNQAIKQNKNCPTYYFYIGMNELQIGNTNLTISNFDNALKINPSDYNSMYYKLIAQYINGNYQDVVDGTSKLLLKHVSNYNSVLYLRALAYTKLNDNDSALQDLNTIENNIGDIFNTDIKKTSAREKSLESYVHYLKAQIQHSKGAGAAEDNSVAYTNPVIDRLSNAQKAMEPYEKSLRSETVSLSDYNKFESFYSTSLPKLLESGAVITYDDIDNQYDYIRTTFADLGISFLYQNPNYRMTTIKDYPYKKYSSKLSNQELETLSARPQSDVANVELAKAQSLTLRKTTPSSELIVQSGQQSLAQMLASNALDDNVKAAEGKESFIKTDAVPAENGQQQFLPETPSAEKIDTSKNIASGELYESNTPAVDSSNTEKVNQILNEEKTMETAPSDLQGENKSQNLVSEIAQKSESVQEAVQEISNNTENIMANAQHSGMVVEKHALDVDIQKKSKSLITYDENDIVELDTNISNKKLNNESDLFDSNTVFVKPKLKNNDITPPVTIEEAPVIKTSKQAAEQISSSVENAVQIPEQIIKNTTDLAQEVILPEQTSQIAVPVVNVPEIEVPKSEIPLKTIAQNNEEQFITDAEQKILSDTQISDFNKPDQEFVKEKLSDVINQIIPEESNQAVISSETATYSDVEMTLSEADKIKAERLKLKEDAKYAKMQKKALAYKEKEEQKLKKAQERISLAEQKAEIKEQKRIQKIEENEKRVNAKQEIKQQKALEKEQLKLAKEKIKQQEVLEQKSEKIAVADDETKIRNLKAKLNANAKSLTAEEKQAQKAQLKAERAQARIEYNVKKLELKNQKAIEKTQAKQIKAEQKAQKYAQKTALKEQKTSEKAVNNYKTKEKFTFKNMFTKMKFWKKD